MSDNDTTLPDAPAIDYPSLTGADQSASTNSSDAGSSQANNTQQDQQKSISGADQNASANDSSAESSQADNAQQDQQKSVSENHEKQPKQDTSDSNEKDAAASNEEKSSNYEKASVEDETDEQWELSNDILKYAKEEKGLLSKEDFQQQGRKEADRIKYVDTDDVEALWNIHPADLEPGKRGLHLKLLELLVHPDKHPGAKGQLKADLEDAFRKLQNTKNYVDNSPKKDTEKGNTKSRAQQPVGEEYIKIYSTKPFLEALVTLFANPKNEIAIRRIEELNEQQIKAYNRKNNRPVEQGVVPIRKLAKLYEEAHSKMDAGWGMEDKATVQLIETGLKIKKLCNDCGLPGSFTWPYDRPGKYRAFWGWENKLHKGIKDRMPSLEDFQQMKESDSGATAPDQHGSNPQTTAGTGQNGTAQTTTGKASEGTISVVTSSFIGFKQAREHKMTFDGKRMLAAKRIAGGNKGGWLIIVKEGTEEAPIYWLRSGKDCGGKLMINGIVEKLPRLGHHDESFLAQEKAEESTFEDILGIVQMNSQTWCNTAWKGRDPFWICRTKLAECLGSLPMVDKLVQDLGAELPLRKEEKEQLMDLALSAPPESTAMISQAQILSQGRLGVALSRRLKHRAFPAPSANSIAQQLSSLRL